MKGTLTTGFSNGLKESSKSLRNFERLFLQSRVSTKRIPPYSHAGFEFDDNKDELFTATSKVRYSVTKGYFRFLLRAKPKIIRYVKYNQEVDSENYFREQLMLFNPWRNEERDILNGYDTYAEHFKAVSDKVKTTKKE